MTTAPQPLTDEELAAAQAMYRDTSFWPEKPVFIQRLLATISHERTLRAEAEKDQHGDVLAAEINALPLRLRKFIHHLESDADPAGDGPG